MEKRPLSLTIIMWFLVILAVLGVVGIVMSASNTAVAAKMAEQSKVPLAYQHVWSAISAVVMLVVAYGIFKGQPWSRVLYVAWGIIGLIVGFITSPMKGLLIFSLVLLVVIGGLLFSLTGNQWFAARGLALKREQG